MLDLEQIAVIGTGLVGASIGLGLKQGGFRGRVVGVGRRQSTLDAALACGAIDAAETQAARALAGSQLAVVAVPLGGFEAVFQDLAAGDHDGLTVTDAGSVKGRVLELAAEHLPDPRRFCGAHPMAGSEHRGPGAASATLFRDRPCVITPAPDTRPEAVRLVSAFWESLGMRLTTMSPQEHDAQCAVISHLPHALAVLLMNAVDECGGLGIASSGLEGASRLASSNPPMRADILAFNRAAVLDALSAFGRHFEAFRAALAAGDHRCVSDTLNHARDARADWLGALPPSRPPAPEASDA